MRLPDPPAGLNPGDLVWIYLRYSSEHQTIESQAHTMQQWCALHNLTIAREWRDAVRTLMAHWSTIFLQSKQGCVSARGSVSLQSLHAAYASLCARGVDIFQGGYMDIRIEQRPIYHLELTEAQARAVVADPAQLQAELAAVLNASGLTVTKPQAKQIAAPRKSHSTKTTKAYTCNKCGQGGFHDKRQLFLHRKAAHTTLPTGEVQA